MVGLKSDDLCPIFVAFPKLSMISHAQLWLLLFVQIEPIDPIKAKIKMNKQTNLHIQQQSKLSIADHAQLWQG